MYIYIYIICFFAQKATGLSEWNSMMDKISLQGLFPSEGSYLPHDHGKISIHT